jgi:hypothetical protein
MSYSDTSQRLSICLRINGFSFSLLAEGNKLMNLADVPLAPVGAGGGADTVAHDQSLIIGKRTKVREKKVKIMENNKKKKDIQKDAKRI